MDTIFTLTILTHNVNPDQTATVNSVILARVLFSGNFAYAKFRENKILVKWRNHSVD